MIEVVHHKRVDYILIWGHGIDYRDEIINMIHDHSEFDILLITNHRPIDIDSLVTTIYSYDYAPLEHLKAKTKYLSRTPDEVVFIFLSNRNPREDYIGEGSFRHEESFTLKRLKEDIRDKLNPKIDGKRTEDHVVHASDNESQTDYILKYLGFDQGVRHFDINRNLIDTPYYVRLPDKIKIIKIPIENLYANILIGEKENYTTVTVPISESPQFQTFSDVSIYQDYLDKYLGGPLQCDYSASKFIEMAKDFTYLERPNHTKYIVATFKNNKLIIQDGLHRSAILKWQGKKEVIIALI